MTKLEELIKELCPNGVEYKKIKNIVTVNRGKRVTKKQLSPDGLYEVYHGSKDSTLGKYDSYNAPANTTIVVNTGGIGGVKFLDKPFWCSDGSFWIGHAENVSSKYLYYCLSGYENYFYSQKREGGVPTIDRCVVEDFQIPVPPLPVQEEIVRILDSFTELTAELTANLTAEITARKKQYEYYRDSLLTFNSQTVQKVKLGDIASIVRGASPRPIAQYITSDSNGVNWIKIGDVKPNSKYITSTEEKITPEGAKKSRLVKKGDFILSNSMSFGRPYILKIDGCIHDGWLSISDFSNTLTADFLYHVLSSSMMQYEMRKKASFGGAVQNLNADIVRELTISIPSLETQNKIVQVLDNFDSICSDLKIGLPAEIEARQKQYEYYRDLLLSFSSDCSQFVNVESRGRAER